MRSSRYWSVLRVAARGRADADDSRPADVQRRRYSVDDLVEAVIRRKRNLDDGERAPRRVGLRGEEYEALSRDGPRHRSPRTSSVNESDVSGTELDRWFSSRDGRATPAGGPGAGELQARLAAQPGRHEGARRLTLRDQPRVAARHRSHRRGGLPRRSTGTVSDGWESDAKVVERVAAIDERYRARFEAIKKEPDRTISPRFVLLHSSLTSSSTSGRWNAATRRRRFENDSTAATKMAGILIYTATTDSAGSLGGVVASVRTRPPRSGRARSCAAERAGARRTRSARNRAARVSTPSIWRRATPAYSCRRSAARR